MFADLKFRKAKRRDVEQIRRLHEEWFPVRYGDDFYEAIAADEDEKCCNYHDGSLRSFQSPFSKTGKSRKYTFSVVAVMDSMSVDLDDIKELRELEEGTSSVTSDVNIDTVEVGEGEEIVGCVVSTLLSSDKNRMIHDLLVKDKHKYPEVAYIMTLGTHAQYRRCGVGQRLVETCIKQAMSNSKCGAIYLHVITYNDAAIYFYERLGFYRITIIEGKYFYAYSHILSKKFRIVLFRILCHRQ